MGMRIEKNHDENFQKLDEVLAQYKDQQGMLIRILQKAQEIFGHLPDEVQSYIAEKTDIPISTVNGVVSFYSFFSQEPQGKYTVGVCLGTACYVKGAQEVLEEIKEELGLDVGETTLDHMFTLKATRCIGACGLAPVITINDDVHGRLSPSDIPSILHQYMKNQKEPVVK
ncbi:NAD(P)H-dependent oxidoreductase subunit E [Petroclostridium sp. X23]|uniref:NADH-quinone oxidoreductase subunit NuoE family protein n=1 Tax=Petroclostridium sp. X23 TaxID=3045146 RepID=UPI0024ACFB85|nr:NAD(P)H-dependent oxidoreductase subunit E [Petroclostridium sp. X23]WHH58069.1 NAD(P)H-dependent oxidoreductase subunit E [Petroclostridium sp. X23]